MAKEAHGLAGHNAIRLWEPEVLAAQQQWLARALQNGRQVVIEPWQERELDFSVQLEMGPRSLKLCGYTGLINDRKGQFQANWAAANCDRRIPGNVAALFRLVSRARVEGFVDFAGYAGSLSERFPLRLEGEPAPKIREGALCLNDPAEAQVCLATFQVSAEGNPPALPED